MYPKIIRYIPSHDIVVFPYYEINHPIYYANLV